MSERRIIPDELRRGRQPESALPYPPPYQDKATLARHLSIGETTIDEYIEAKLLPPPRQGKERGKLLWKWSEVCEYVDNWSLAGPSIVPSQSSDQESRAERVRNATQKSANRAAAG